MTYTLAGESFATKEAIRRRIQTILAQTPNGHILDEEAARLMRAVVMWHPASEEKVGSGIAGFTVRADPVYPGSRGFVLIRTDGTTTDFSYRKCLQPPTHRALLIKAARCTIEPMIHDFKRTYFAKWEGIECHCPITGEILTYGHSHVDHAPPRTFAALWQEYLQRLPIDPSHIGLCQTGDNVTQLFFADNEFELGWMAFHSDYARLRMVSPAGNAQIAREEAQKKVQAVANPQTRESLMKLWDKIEP